MKQQKESMKLLLAMATLCVLSMFVAGSAHALTDTTQPTIVSVSPTNTEQDAARLERITVTFSEEMNPATINKNTFIVMQRTTPQTGETVSRTIDGAISYLDRTATFTPREKLSPDQRYGNVFTATITPGATDLAGNALARDYVWSFTTGSGKYNTGASTSQTNQSATGGAVAPPAQVPPATEAVTSVQGSGSYLWAWILGGALLALAALAFFAMRKPGRTPTSRKSTRLVRASPFGDVHRVMDLEGIGPVYSKKLQDMGIEDTKQLWSANAKKVADATNAPLVSVVSWQHMAELSSIHDIGPQYAELLERSGVHSIEQLRNYKTTDLLKLVLEKEQSLGVSIQGNTPGTALVGNWIEQAHEHGSGKSRGST